MAMLVTTGGFSFTFGTQIGTALSIVEGGAAVVSGEFVRRNFGSAGEHRRL
ncbi:MULTISPECIES: hypothetical protein [unclassified Burkholderia]|uniref:hypothetical protein n=1 Tax=unclassified Burkholderia TaxID=2613784 RepID=UPI000AF6896D|nr:MULTISPECIES: hypothetical protein [unclassified Burkholderia]